MLVKNITISIQFHRNYRSQGLVGLLHALYCRTRAYVKKKHKIIRSSCLASLKYSRKNNSGHNSQKNLVVFYEYICTRVASLHQRHLSLDIYDRSLLELSILSDWGCVYFAFPLHFPFREDWELSYTVSDWGCVYSSLFRCTLSLERTESWVTRYRIEVVCTVHYFAVLSL